MTATENLKAGLTQVLADGVSQRDDNNTYLNGVGCIGEVAAANWAYHNHDALGSLRQLTDADGTVTLSKSYLPYGDELSSSGVGDSSYGFTGEITDVATGLVYLRARYYAPSQGSFLTQDVWDGDPYSPMAYNKWLYGYANPIRWVDHSGKQSHDPNCDVWPSWINAGYGSIQELCKIADWDDNRGDWDLVNNVPDHVLEAREKIYRTLIRGSAAYYLATGDLGYAQTSEMFKHFLDSNGANKHFKLSQIHPFVNDPGITRATRGPASSAKAFSDEPEVVVPLLFSFMVSHVRPAVLSESGSQSIGPVPLFGLDHYYPGSERDTGLEPRPHSESWWAAFGHVTIDGTFSAEVKFSCTLDGYLTNYKADYHISDMYTWFEDKNTPLPLPGIPKDAARVPHLWAISLTRSNPRMAQDFEYTIDWSEKNVLLTQNFYEYKPIPNFYYLLP